MGLSLNDIRKFFSTLALDGDGKNGQFHKVYIRQTVEAFLDNENGDTALRVYMSFCYAYRFSQRGDTFIDLLDMMKNYEEGTGSLVRKQRDHYIHSVNVFLLGLCMYSRNSSLRNYFGQDTKAGMYFSSVQEEFFFRWGLASLFHDIGYPVEIISKQLEMFFENAADIPGSTSPKIQAQVFISNFDSFNTLSEWAGNGSAPDSVVNPRKALDIIAVSLHERLGLDFARIKELLDGLPENMRKSGFVDHGFFSALIILRWYASLIQQNGINSSIFPSVIDSASAIFLHNYYGNILIKEFAGIGPLKASAHPLAYLLILCDELQEWHRETYTRTDKADFVACVANIEISNDRLSVQYHMERFESSDESRDLCCSFKEKKRNIICERLDMGALFMEGFLLDAVINFGSEPAVKIRMPLRQLVSNIEALAKASHTQYLKEMVRKGKTGPAAVAWEALGEDEVMQNFRQASAIVDKLAIVNCGFASPDILVRAVESFTEDEIEAMAVWEHADWVREHVKNGWVYAAVRDDEKKSHPCLIPWDKLPEEYREFNRENVRNIIPLLQSIGLKVYRL
ncbi:RyR domain-containing protein [Parasporobacterium paucivorans]|uniref:RyR domain-containing protein n=1 Tax=Parasporobacterium paucivorans DSM 15970 TaxID=1122934 RepID=A0A1M6JYJ3_9FIRM|nr:RyR domain-containing protein [Parasporobacterium paucivorans]SHJ51754.1 RyR domain-containing protein [Parasporobacterium paucivorans DSM 15970]